MHLFVIALPFEAQSIIKNRNFVQIGKSGGGKLYHSKAEKSYLLVTGMGADRVRRSMASLVEFQGRENVKWDKLHNLGLAADLSQSSEIGTCFQVQTVFRADEAEGLNGLEIGFESTAKWCRANLQTVDAPVRVRGILSDSLTDQPVELFDMEGWEIVNAAEALLAVPRNRCYLCKVVSDYGVSEQRMDMRALAQKYDPIALDWFDWAKRR